MSFTSLLGQQFGRLTVISRAQNDRHGKSVWVCKCSCGQEKLAVAQALTRGEYKSCGCSKYANPRIKHGLSKSKEYYIWNGMVGRCHRENSQGYHLYGGRGISVCAEWRDSFDNFIADMGMRPTPSHSIDRIDVNGNYEKSNCRWATSKEQAANRRDNIVLTYKGKTTKFLDLYSAEPRAVPVNIARDRIRNGWAIDYALSALRGAPKHV